MPNDVYGRPVPLRLSAAFQAREDLLEWCGQWHELQVGLANFVHQHPDIASDPAMCKAIEEMEQAKKHVMEALPAVACDCGPYERSCPKCEGRKWLNGSRYLLVPWSQPELVYKALSPDKESANTPQPAAQRLAG